MKYKKSISANFTFYKKETYAKSKLFKTNKLNLWKLHISVDENSYGRFKNAITAFLLDQLIKNKGSINGFKIVNFEMIDTKIYYLNKLRHLLLCYKNQLKGNRNIDFDMHELQQLFIEYCKPMNRRTLPSLDEIDWFINRIDYQLMTFSRFYKGDQFTCYLPHDVNYQDLLSLCQAINRFLTQSGAIPGEYAKDVAAAISPFINMRQEYSLEDWNTFHCTKNINRKKRINAIPEENNELKRKERYMVKQELVTSHIYKSICSDMEAELCHQQSVSVSHLSIFKSMPLKVDEQKMYNNDNDISHHLYQSYY